MSLKGKQVMDKLIGGLSSKSKRVYRANAPSDQELGFVYNVLRSNSEALDVYIDIMKAERKLQKITGSDVSHELSRFIKKHLPDVMNKLDDEIDQAK